MVRVFSRFSGQMYFSRLSGSSRTRCVNPSHPRRMPITSQLFSVARYTTLLITELSPGTSPPPVRMPILRRAMKLQFIEFGVCGSGLVLANLAFGFGLFGGCRTGGQRFGDQAPRFGHLRARHANL